MKRALHRISILFDLPSRRDGCAKDQVIVFQDEVIERSGAAIKVIKRFTNSSSIVIAEASDDAVSLLESCDKVKSVTYDAINVKYTD